MSNKKTFNLKTSSKRRAFSLIELSIVLIIIGLLIAGITGGASLIKSASLRAAMGEARGYNVAVNSFYVQFDGLPGDYATQISTSPGSVAGNGNGRIEYASAGDICENINAWLALKSSGVIDTVFTGTMTTACVATTTTSTPGSTVPSSKVKSAGWLFDYNTNSMAMNMVILSATASGAAKTTGNAALVVPVGIIPPNDALSIDTKMDDGLPAAGKVRAVVGGAATVVSGTCYDNDTPNSSGSYATVNTGNNCSLGFQVDIT